MVDASPTVESQIHRFESVRVLLVRKQEEGVSVNKLQSFQELKESIPRENAYFQNKTSFSEITWPA